MYLFIYRKANLFCNKYNKSGSNDSKMVAVFFAAIIIKTIYLLMLLGYNGSNGCKK